MLRLIPLALALLLAGCLAPAAPPAAVEADLWGGADRQVLVDIPKGFVAEWDTLCVQGGGPELGRADGRVLPGTGHLEVRVSVDPGFTGLQVGYAIDGGDVTWLEVVTASEATFEVPVTPEQAEQPGGGTRWSFFEQMNLPPPATQPCYTGGGAGSWGVAIDAVRG